jgi:hypothetical protein
MVIKSSQLLSSLHGSDTGSVKLIRLDNSTKRTSYLHRPRQDVVLARLNLIYWHTLICVTENI